MIKKIFLFFLIFNLILITGCSCESKTSESKDTKTTQIITAPEGKVTPQSYTIIIQNNKFTPVDLDIRVGDTVTWINRDAPKNNITNQDDLRHTITFEDARLDQVLTKGAQVSYTFKEKEEARYFCKFHSGMQGSVKVS